MNKKNLIITGLVLLIALTAGTSGYLIAENLNLKNEITLRQEEADEKIAQLEDRVKAKQKEEARETAEPEASAQKIAAGTTQFMNEDELLANFFGVSGTAAENPEGTSETYLVVTPETRDLGTISKQDGVVSTTFEIKNEGDAAITLSYAFTSCGCTATPLKQEKVLEPGEVFPLEVSYDPNFYGPSYELGEITKSVTILSNDPVNPFYKVNLKANVVP